MEIPPTSANRSNLSMQPAMDFLSTMKHYLKEQHVKFDDTKKFKELPEEQKIKYIEVLRYCYLRYKSGHYNAKDKASSPKSRLDPKSQQAQLILNSLEWKISEEPFCSWTMDNWLDTTKEVNNKVGKITTVKDFVPPKVESALDTELSKVVGNPVQPQPSSFVLWCLLLTFM
jgi:hypothetical protein